MTAARDYRVAPLRKSSIASLVVLLMLLPLGAAIAGFVQPDVERDTIRLLQLLFVSALPAALLVPALLRRRVEFDGRTLTIKSAFHTRRPTLDELDLDSARIVDLNERKELRPMLRRFGFALVGFRAGHYRLRNWQKAFALLTRRERVLALSERGGMLLLLSLERPQQLIDDLRAAAARP